MIFKYVDYFNIFFYLCLKTNELPLYQPNFFSDKSFRILIILLLREAVLVEIEVGVGGV